MPEVFAYALASVILVSIVSLLGLFAVPSKSKNLIYLVSFAAGALFGDSFIHLLPETIELGFSEITPVIILSGIVTMFIVEKIIHWHHSHGTAKSHHTIKPFAFMNLIGDGVHNFIDGMVIGASYLTSLQLGIATTLAVVFHEIPQEVGDFGVLLKSGINRSKAVILNLFSALTAVLGAVFALFLNSYVPNLTAAMMPFTIGVFVYIAGSDLIPELHKEKGTANSIKQLLSFVAGIAVMYALLAFE